jgi:phage shock protein A
MPETLTTRVGRVIAGGLHALIDRLEDQAPDAMMEQSVREAESVIGEVRHELGLVSANRHLAQQQHARLNGQHETLAAQIELALAQGREDLARAAVARQLDIEAQIPVLETTLAEHARQEHELQGYVAALLAKKREMQESLAEFRTSRGAASAGPAGPASDEAGRRTGGAAGVFDRLYQRQTGMPAAARNTGPQQEAQLKELDELVRANKIAERLAQIKASKA